MKMIWKICAGVLLSFFVLTIAPVLCFRWIDPPASAFMIRQAAKNCLARKPMTIRHRWTDWDDIAPPMGLAVVAAEDQKFPLHRGFDFESIVDAQKENRTRRRQRGASTITQQVAKNLFLWPGRSWMRKGLEAYYAVLLELLWTKRRILEVYLNVAEFGENTYGVGAAARVFFKKTPAQLSRGECALLAAVLPNPRRFHPERPSRYVRERASWILQQMDNLGLGYLEGM